MVIRTTPLPDISDKEIEKLIDRAIPAWESTSCDEINNGWKVSKVRNKIQHCLNIFIKYKNGIVKPIWNLKAKMYPK